MEFVVERDAKLFTHRTEHTRNENLGRIRRTTRRTILILKLVCMDEYDYARLPISFHPQIYPMQAPTPSSRPSSSPSLSQPSHASFAPT